MEFVKGPDFPTGALILGRSGAMDAYTHRSRLDPHARGGGDRRGQERRPHRRHRDPVPDLRRGHRAQDRRPREQPRDRRRARPAQRVGEGQDEARHRAEEGRQPARHAEQPLQAHADADELRREHAGAGGRRAPHAEPRRRAHRLREPPDRRRHPPVRVPAAQGQGARPHRRGPHPGARRDRRDHHADPRVGGHRRGAPGPDGEAVRVLRDPGEPHPGHAAAPPRPARAAEAEGRARRAAGDHQGARVDPAERREAARPSSRKSSPR